ncbi:FCD domain-containing protein [Microvirga tunisiensis]|uniref:FCD domain-containing protein n=2 Tax=Pannonibacter tanglangensis TaxID=2750084 RepID=A0ABW9ZDW8_9HYPH|nr:MULTISPECIES: GntR family transcriptional regulator [unclassified Pannonibacter]NBN63038.1 FCD domain-containing protein [Pannonibacter sp. XCT-34]NBN78610.1 FCD domain-containing protein [Pannonibacter sp. XCT-53]
MTSPRRPHREQVDLLARLTAQEGGRKSNHVYCDLKRRIVLGELTGASILTEQAIAQDYDCSQGTVREALLRLEQDGLVDRKGYQGTFVTQLTPAEAEAFVRLRLELECAGIARACERMDAEARAFVQQSAQDYRQMHETGELYGLVLLDRAFHMRLFEQADMPNLLPLLSRALLQLHRYTISQRPDVRPWFDLRPDPHADIIAALESGTPALCRQRMFEHIRANIQAFAPEIFDRVFDRGADPAERRQRPDARA